MNDVAVYLVGQTEGKKTYDMRKRVSMGGGFVTPGLCAHVASTERQVLEEKKCVSTGGGTVVPGLAAHLAAEHKKASPQQQGVSMGGGLVIPGLCAHMAANQRKAEEHKDVSTSSGEVAPVASGRLCVEEKQASSTVQRVSMGGGVVVPRVAAHLAKFSR